MTKLILVLMATLSLILGCQTRSNTIPHDWGDIYSACRKEATADYCQRRLGRDH